MVASSKFFLKLFNNSILFLTSRLVKNLIIIFTYVCACVGSSPNVTVSPWISLKHFWQKVYLSDPSPYALRLRVFKNTKRSTNSQPSSNGSSSSGGGKGFVTVWWHNTPMRLICVERFHDVNNDVIVVNGAENREEKMFTVRTVPVVYHHILLEC